MTPRLPRLLVLAATLVALPALAAPRDPRPTSQEQADAAGAGAVREVHVPIEQRLSAEQMRATGLDRLSRDELALLNRLLEADRVSAVEKARTQARAAAVASVERQERAAVDSRIKGTFRGWQPGTVITLENGERWRVTEGDYTARAVESPKASIRPGMLSGWYLRVDGQIPTAKVKPAD